jgi:hypothetical protein
VRLLLLAAIALSGCLRVEPIAHGAIASPMLHADLAHAEIATRAGLEDFGATVEDGEDPTVITAVSGEGDEQVKVTISLFETGHYVEADIRLYAPSLPWSEQKRDLRFLASCIASRL